MFARIHFILSYWIMWVFIFIFARIGFLLFNFKQTRESGFENAVGSILHGIRMDMSMAVYLIVPVCLMVIAALFIPVMRKRKLYVIYSAIILLPVLLLVFVDMGLFPAWGARVDASFLRYLSNPQEVWASIAHLPVIWIFLGFVAMYILLIVLINKLLKGKEYLLHQRHKPAIQLGLVVLLMAVMIIPLRGGFQLAPMNQSTVYFSDDHYANLAAINAPWNFVHDVMHRNKDNENAFKYMDDAEAINIVNSMYAKPLVDSAITLTPSPNVLLIIWESLTEKVVGVKHQGVEITPGLNQLIESGVYFSNAYATGDRTDKGVVGILSGYPAQPTTSIVKMPTKAASLPMISKDFNRAGYQTAYYYGGELAFANLKAYLMQGGFQHFVAMEDFDEKDHNSKWGAHDGVVMEKLLGDMQKVSSPFFYTWLTLSSHEPYETPVAPRIKGNDHESQFFNVMHYTDSVVYRFIDQCKQLPWWDNTVVVIVGDHGHPLPKKNERSDNFRIPLLFTGGAVQQKMKIHDVVSQNDIAATLLKMVNLSHDEYKWSRDLFQNNYSASAFFTFNNGFGFATNEGVYLFDNVGKRIIESTIEPSTKTLSAGKAMQQLTFQDYLAR